MATDISRIINNLEDFYDFSGRSVIHVGAGGGQGIGYARLAGSVLAVDNDDHAIEMLEEKVAEHGLRNVTLVNSDFFELDAAGDLVFFEFCLHEIDRPDEALKKAFRMADSVLVMDHAPASKWAWYCAESEKAERSWSAVEKHDIERDREFTASQRFVDFDTLRRMVEVLGEPSLTRIKEFTGGNDIEVEMIYRIALVRNREGQE